MAGYVLDGSGRQAPAVAYDKRTLVLPMPPTFSRNQGDSITVTISDNGRQIGSVLHGSGPTAFRWTCG